MSTPDTAKKAWQAYASDTKVPTLEQVRRGAAKFDRQIRIRNGIEYAAGLFVLVSFTYQAITEPYPWTKLANVLVLIGTCFVMWQLYRRGSVLERSEDAPLSGLLAHQRRSLVRQRDALKSVFWWYLLPFIPGMLVFVITTPQRPGQEWMPVAFAGVMLLLFLGIWLWNQKWAARLQDAIDEIDALDAKE